MSGHRFALELTFKNEQFWQVDQKIAQSILEEALHRGLRDAGYLGLLAVKVRPLRKLSVEKDTQ